MLISIHELASMNIGYEAYWEIGMVFCIFHTWGNWDGGGTTCTFIQININTGYQAYWQTYFYLTCTGSGLLGWGGEMVQFFVKSHPTHFHMWANKRKPPALSQGLKYRSIRLSRSGRHYKRQILLQTVEYLRQRLNSFTYLNSVNRYTSM